MGGIAQIYVQYLFDEIYWCETVAWQAVIPLSKSSRQRSSVPYRAGYDRCFVDNLNLFFCWERGHPSRQESRRLAKLSRESPNGGGAWTTIAYRTTQASAVLIIGHG
jgi:hypothetical protein